MWTDVNETGLTVNGSSHFHHNEWAGVDIEISCYISVTGAEIDNNGQSIAQGSVDATLQGRQLSEIVIACFAAGTRIATARGAVAVEALHTGDLAATAGGGWRPVMWTGHRRVDCRRHPRPASVQPVRVRAHAFGPGAPHADLLLSPDHAVFVEGALIPVRQLVNGTSVARCDVPTVVYWHVELDAHDVLLAEGLPCESFLDTGQRGAFAEGGAVRQLHADFAARLWDAAACAPLALAGPAVQRARARLARQAGMVLHDRIELTTPKRVSTIS